MVGRNEASVNPTPARVRIGRYELVREIGSGGFGTVWLAEQEEPVRRTVAVKIIKLGMDTAEVVARFEAERQALAMMDHPHIAKVLDGGATDAGRPYFVMELVEGVPITQFCDDEALPAEARLALFCDICRAVQHAHQKGLIHRDLKPSNVLVARRDGKPAPKIIDFGIAKATRVRLTEKTMLTEVRQILGTPEYMAPEQASTTREDIDTRADIYSLGVLLYELLTGTKPLDLKTLGQCTYDELVRMIREVDPPRPSTRIAALGPESRAIATRRGTTPRPLGKYVRGDLDWITLKALEKDRARRYDSATALAEDVERFLSDRPVRARPPSAAYRVSKYVRRHRLGVAAASAVAIALISGAVAAYDGYLEARAQRDRAEIGEAAAQREAHRAKAVVDLVTEMLESADPYAGPGENQTVGEILDRFDAGLGDRLAHEPEVEAEIRRLIGRTYRGLGLLDKATPQLEAAAQIRRRELGDTDDRTLTTIGDLVLAEHDGGDFAAAEAIARAGLEAARAAEHESTATARLQYLLGSTISARGRDAEAVAELREALASQTRLAAGDLRAVANVRYALARSLASLGELEEADRLFGEVIAALDEIGNRDDPFLGMVQDNYARLLQDRGRLAEAEALFRVALAQLRRRLGDAHPDVGTTASNLALLRTQQGDAAEAEALYREALEIYRQRLGDDHPDFVVVSNNLALLRESLGDPDEAEAILRAALASSARRGPGDIQVRSARHALVRVVERRGRRREATDLLRESLALEVAREPRSMDWMTGDMELLGSKLTDLALAESAAWAAIEAEGVLRECLEQRTRAFGADDARIPLTQLLLGGALTAIARVDDSLDRAQRAERLAEAEKLLLAGFEPSPPAARESEGETRERERLAAGRLVRLYDEWHRLDPAAGRAADAERWRAKLAELGGRR